MNPKGDGEEYVSPDVKDELTPEAESNDVKVTYEDDSKADNEGEAPAGGSDAYDVEPAV